MLLLYNISKWSQGLCSCTRTRFHTSSKSFKWPTALKPTNEVIEKPKPIKIWENMTIWDLAKSLKKDLDFVENVLKPVLENKYDKLDGKINDLGVVKKFIVKEGRSFSLIQPIRSNVLKYEKRKRRIPAVLYSKSEGTEVERPPIVTIMGHVDHGKTTLLDALRNSNIAANEFGGITQHIGAFSVALTPGKSVTFIDTPGHAAFSAMRNRGAEITDIVVLIVAADDGVMEQTVESIKMAKNAGVNILVAVNKIDKAPSNKLVKIKQQLLEEGVQAEDLGGDVQVIPISALKRQNLDKLIEALLLEAGIMGLTGDPNAPLEGVVLESCMGAPGKLATIIVKRGTLRKRKILLAGKALARVRAMYNEDGVELSEVTLSQAAQISGWRDLPKAGDRVIEVESEKDARTIIRQGKQEELHNRLLRDYQVIQQKSVQAASEHNERKQYIAKLRRAKDIQGLKQAFMKKAADKTEISKLDIIIKGDVDGSIEAVTNIIDTYDCDELIKLQIVHSGVGNITDSDIELAEIFDATIYCFNIPFPEELKSVIAEKGIRIRFHNVIYRFIDDLKEEISSLLTAKEEEVVIGTAEVLKHFTLTDKRKKLSAAGCACVMGELRKDLFYRIIRDDNILYDGKLKSLKHFKNEVNIIKKDTQCGVMFEDFNEEFKTGDKIICYEKQLKQPLLTWNPGF